VLVFPLVGVRIAGVVQGAMPRHRPARESTEY
jgi:hypothetical protein